MDNYRDWEEADKRKMKDDLAEAIRLLREANDRLWGKGCADLRAAIDTYLAKHEVK